VGRVQDGVRMTPAGKLFVEVYSGVPHMLQFNLEEMCIEAMSKMQSHFGLTGLGGGKLEKDFQEALTDELNAIGATRNVDLFWKREAGYKTYSLTNKQRMTIDIGGVIMGRLVAAIELKYVTVNYKNGSKTSSDIAAFPYEIAKDCIRLELLVDRAYGGRACSPDKNAPQEVSRRLQTCVIALTNVPKFPGGGWSQNFARQLRGRGPVELSNDLSKEPPRIEVVTNNPETIYLRRRAHISLGLTWKGQWRPYTPVEVTAHTSDFRYLFIKPATETARPNWGAEVSDTLPFRTKMMRAEYDRIAADQKQSRSNSMG
jgi:hypothetical protein